MSNSIIDHQLEYPEHYPDRITSAQEDPIFGEITTSNWPYLGIEYRGIRYFKRGGVMYGFKSDRLTNFPVLPDRGCYPYYSSEPQQPFGRLWKNPYMDRDQQITDLKNAYKEQLEAEMRDAEITRDIFDGLKERM